MSGRTHPPTARRLREARRRGEVAVSRDLCGAAALCAGAAALAAAAPALEGALAGAVRRALLAAAGAPPQPAAVAGDALRLLARTALPPCGAAAGAALAAGLLQTRGLVATAALRPRLDRLRPGPALRRLASPARLAGAALQPLRLLLGLAAVARALAPAAPGLAAASALGAGPLLRALGAAALRLAIAAAAVLAALGALELVTARALLRRRLRMTRDEVLRERRDDEGDPRTAAERRRRHRALALAPPLARATCLVVNPTHVAVALRHDPASDDAPVVLAKGVGAAAARLRALARRAGVPVVEDVALARALHRLADVGDAIPEELYEAAAAVLVHVHAAAREPA